MGWRPEAQRPRQRVQARSASLAATGGALDLALWLRRFRQALRDALDLKAAFLTEVDARRLFLWLPICMGCGVVLFFAADGVPSPWPALVVAAVLLGLAWRLRVKLLTPVLLVALAFVFLGFGSIAWRTQLASAPVLDRPAFAKLSAFVETVDAGPNGGRMVLVITRFESVFPVVNPQRLRVTFRGNGPRAGDHLSGQARLMPPPQPAFPGGYDFARDAYFLGLGAVGRWSGPMILSPAPRALDAGLWLTTSIDNARTDMTNRIARAIGGQAGALSAALVTGKRGLLEERINDDLRASGLYHIVSISGLHMVLAAGVFFWLARAILALIPGVAERYPIKKWAAALAMLGATAYCIFSGSDVATERSLIMTLTLLAAVLFDRPALSMRNLAIAALIVLVREPETMAGPSFQMSFAAVAAMIAAHEWWLSLERQRPEPGGWGGIFLRKAFVAVAGSVVTTLIASFATAPFAAYHFQRVNPYGLIGNAMAIPFVSFIVMPAAVAGTLLMPFGLDAPVWQLMGLGSDKVLEVARYVAIIDGSVRGVRAFPMSDLLVMAMGFVVLVLVRSPLRLLGLGAMLVATLTAGRSVPPDVFIDRQGNLAAVRAADGRLQILSRSTSRFTVDRWLAADGDLRKANDPALKLAAACDRLGCTGRLANGASVAVVLSADIFEEDCARAKLVITPLVAPAFCRNTAVVIDRNRLASAASLTLYLQGDGFREVEARPSDNWKPWYGRPEKPVPVPERARQGPRSGEAVVREAIAREAEPVPSSDPASEASDDGSDMILP